MNALSRRVAWALPLLAVLAVAGGCKRSAAPLAEKVLVFPTLAERQDQLDTLQLRGAGKATLVTLRRKENVWRVAERTDWPADAGRISQYLFVLSQARLAEAKTSNPELYARIGVGPITDEAATGSELTLSGKGISSRLLIGHEHTKFDSNYVRVDGQAQAWLTDLPVTFDRDPASWLDRRLVDLPLARIVAVQVKPRSGKPFALSHRDDRFRLDDAPSAAMGDSQQGDALAGVLDQLRFEDLAVDDGKLAAERELQFTTVDGLQLTIQAWHAGDQLWVRLAASADAARAGEWARQLAVPVAASGSKSDSESKSLSERVAELNQRFHARRFLLPANVATVLMLGHDEILAGAPSP